MPFNPPKYPVILHITDMHFGQPNDSEVSRNRVQEGLLHALSHLELDWQPSIVCLTGDVAFKGHKNEYALAEKFLTRLFEVLKRPWIPNETALPRDRVLICAGNHDVERVRGFEADRVLLEPRFDNDHVRKTQGDKGRLYIAKPDTADNVLGWPVHQTLTDTFQNFEDFAQRMNFKPYELHGRPSFLVGSREIDSLRFIGLNSAWFCRDNDDQGKLWIGFHHLEHLFPITNGNPNDKKTTVTLVHHPREWYNEAEFQATHNPPRTNVWDLLAINSHLILTGHTHGEVRRADRFAEHAYHLSGGAMYADASHNNSFRLIRVEDLGFRHRSIEFRAQYDGWSPLQSRDGFLQMQDATVAQGVYRFAHKVGLATTHPIDENGLEFDRVFNWSKNGEFSHDPFKVPNAQAWDALIQELMQARPQFTGRIHLTVGPKGRPGGSLSAAVAFGNTFRSNAIDVDQLNVKTQRIETWRSDELPSEEITFEAEPHWEAHNASSNEAILALSFAPGRNVTDAAASLLMKPGFQVSGQLHLRYNSKPLTGPEARALSLRVQQVMNEYTAQHKIRQWHLLIASPFAMAVFVGMTLNRAGKIQVYEYDPGEQGYIPTALLET